MAQPRDPAQAVHGVLWQNGAVKDLGNLGGTGEATTADDINDHGTVVGFSYTGAQTHAFLWRAGVMRDLGVTAPGHVAQTSGAAGVNDHEVVIGYTQVAAGPQNGWEAGVPAATVWRDGVGVDLNRLVTNLPKGTHLRVAQAINDQGVIVGGACTLVDDCAVSDATFALVPIS